MTGVLDGIMLVACAYALLWLLAAALLIAVWVVERRDPIGRYVPSRDVAEMIVRRPYDREADRAA